MRLVIVIAVVLSPLACLFAQQPNTALAGLSLNGTGRIDAGGTAIPTSSMISPPPTGSAPIFHHRTSPGASLELRVDGPPAMPFILLAGSPAATPIAIGPDLLEIDVATIQLLLNGSAPMNFFDFSAFVGFDGVGQLFNTIGLPPGFGPLTLQAVIVDPSAAPFGFRITASVTLEVEGSLDTLMRNVADGLNEALTNPFYLESLGSTGFLHEGLTAAQLVASQAAAAAGLSDGDSFQNAQFDQIGPDPINAPPLPSGLPTPGQSRTIYFQTLETFDDPFCGATQVTLAERYRLPRLEVIEQGGIWKVHGNQEEVLIEGELDFSAGASNASGVDVRLQFFVEELLGRNGGVAGVTITGPQLANLDGLSRSTSAAGGSQPMTLDDGGGSAPSCWSFEAVLADASAGSSRLPLVENGAGPRDTYQFTITWNDASTSGPYTFVLRSAIDVSANPAAVLAAIPGQSGVTGSLLSGGTANASVNLTFPVGNLSANLFSSMSVGMFQAGLDAEFGGLFSPFAPATTPTVNFCTPFFVSGIPTSYFTVVFDIFDTSYAAGGNLNL